MKYIYSPGKRSLHKTVGMLTKKMKNVSQSFSTANVHAKNLLLFTFSTKMRCRIYKIIKINRKKLKKSKFYEHV